MNLLTYNGLKLTSRLLDDGFTGEVKVFNPDFPRNPPLFQTTSLDLAMKWVDGYLAGHCEPRRPLLADTNPPARTKAAAAFRKALK